MEKILQRLSASDIELLQAEELKWIEAHDEEAEKSLQEYEGGSIAPLNFISTMLHMMQDRCYELVNHYMK
jgi:Uncharacterized protein conserved in bacteria